MKFNFSTLNVHRDILDNPFTILIVVAHDALRIRLSEWLKDALQGVEIYVAKNGDEVAALVETIPLDIAIVDLELPGSTAIQITGFLQARRPGIKIVLITFQEAMVFRKVAEAAGVNSFVLKQRMHADLLPALESILHQMQHRF